MQIMSQCYSFLQGYSSEYFLYIYVTNDHVQHKKKTTNLIQRYIEFSVLGRQNTVVSLKTILLDFIVIVLLQKNKTTIAKQKNLDN